MALPFFILSRLIRTAPEPALADYRYGYQSNGSHKALSAALSLGVVGLVGTTLVLALVTPKFVPNDPGPLVTHNVPPPVTRTDPPPVPQTDPTRTSVDSPRVIDTPPVIDRGLPPIGDFTLNGNDLIDIRIPDSGGIGSGGGVVSDPVEPVFRAAQRNPRFADRFQPRYPPTMERAGEAGTSRVRVTIAATGRVIAVVDLGSSDPLFFEATRRQALEQWRFLPATRDGTPVESTQELTVTFRIPER